MTRPNIHPAVFAQIAQRWGVKDPAAASAAVQRAIEGGEVETRGDLVVIRYQATHLYRWVVEIRAGQVVAARVRVSQAYRNRRKRFKARAARAAAEAGA